MDETQFDIPMQSPLNWTLTLYEHGTMNSEAVQELIASKPELKASKAKLESMKAGAFCVHRSWGFGQIKEYDSVSRKLVIDFEDKPGHAMDPAFCVNTMEVLPPEHLLVRRITEPKKIKEMIEDNPVELVIDGLKTCENQATTALDLELTLAQVVGPDKFKRWWASVKKQLASDPRVGVPAKKTECYVLREEPISAEDEILEQFNGTRSARRRITLAAALLASMGKKDRSTDSTAFVLKEIVASVKDSNQLGAAERLEGAWVRNDLAAVTGDDASAFSPTPEELVADTHGLIGIAEKLGTTHHHRFLELVQKAHPLEWKELVLNLLKNSSGKFTTECINFLVESDCTELLATTLQRWKLEQNLRAPVLLWIVKNRASRKFAKLLSDMITPRLLSSIFFAIDYEALQTGGARRIPLADMLSEDKELIPDLLSTSDPETARDLANSLILNQGFEELTRKSLLARFIKQFPAIQSLVSNDSEERGEVLLVSRGSFERKRKEYDEIVQKRIPDNSRAIAAAREHGDLRENAEYKMAKQDQSLLLAQKAQIERDLRNARVSEFTEATIDVIGVGSVAELKDLNSGKPVTYTILGAWDSDPENFVISYKAPLGMGLLSKRVGDQVKLKVATDEHNYEVVAIRRFVDKK